MPNLVTKVVQTVIRKRTYQVKDRSDLITVMDQLLTERHTGTATIHLSQGGVQGMCAEDKADLGEKT